MIKQLVRQLVPVSLYRSLRYARRAPALYRAALYDLGRYTKHSSAVHYDDQEDKLRAIITATYHNIEKGLSLPEPRLGFGKDNLARLVGFIDECLSKFGPRPYLAVPISAIGAYIAFHEARDFDVAVLRRNYERLRELNASEQPAEPIGGVRRVSKEEVMAAVTPVTMNFFTERFSCRQFSERPLTAEQIEIAARVAQKSPAVCNRQSGKIYAFTEATDITRILELQGGARGFAGGVTALFCIAVDLRNFHGTGERYQGWIDGGLFAMSFIYGLHMQGIGSCCLNWSKTADENEAMHALINVPENESIIMFVAAGHLKDEFTVAQSIRKPLDEILSFRTGKPCVDVR